MFALNSLRILDLAGEKGMFCSRLLADMGADVVRVEPPGGDSSRNIGPFLNDEPHSEKSLSFWYQNTNKRSITLKLESNKGQEIFKKLIATTDVIVENFQPGYLEKLGLGYEALKNINPGIIMTSITDFGQTGPYRDYKSCDLVSSALGGQMYVCGDKDTPPLKPHGEQPYLVSSLFAAIGTMLALRFRRFSNEGQHVDISIHECVAGTLEHVNVQYLYNHVIAKRHGSLHWNNAFRVFPCQDGYILLTLFQQWETMIELMDSEGMADDLSKEKYLNPQIRHEEIIHIINVIEQWTLQHTVHDIVVLGQSMHFPWSAVNSIEEVCNNEQLLERGFFVEVENLEIEASFKFPGLPYKSSESEHRILTRAPLIGEHNLQVFQKELGFSEADLEKLILEGII